MDGTSYMTNSDWQALYQFFGCFAIFGIIMLVFYVFVFWRILDKAGYSPWLSLLTLIPFGIFAVLLVLAFGRWPSSVAGSYPSASYYGSTPTGDYVPPAPSYTAPPQPAPPVYQPPIYQPPARPSEPPSNTPPSE